MFTFLAIAPLVLQGISMISNARQQAKANDLAADAQVSNLQYQLSTSELSLIEAHGNLSIYEEALSMLPTEQAADLASFESEAERQFDTLMSNFAMSNVSAAAKGQIGGGTSAGLVAAEQQEKLSDFAGSDLTLNDDTEGLYGLKKTALLNQQELDKIDVETKVNTYRQTVDELTEVIADLNTSLTKAKKNADSETGSFWGNMVKKTLGWGIKIG